MSLSDLLELSLNLTDCVVLELLNLLKCTTDHTHSLWVDSCCGKNLIDLSVLRFETFLDGLELLL